MTPTARTLKHCKEAGQLAGVVERYNSFTKRRHDLFGFIDVVALTPDGTTIGIQTTSGSNAAARIRKIRGECAQAADLWLKAGNRIEVHGWRKLKGRWQVRVIELGATVQDVKGTSDISWR